MHPLNSNGIVAQLDRASHYGCEGLGFESLQCHHQATKSPTKVGDFWFEGVTHSHSHPVSPTHSHFEILVKGSDQRKGEIENDVKQCYQSDKKNFLSCPFFPEEGM